jgi:hypothetical protein
LLRRKISMQLTREEWDLIDGLVAKRRSSATAVVIELVKESSLLKGIHPAHVDRSEESTMTVVLEHQSKSYERIISLMIDRLTQK